MLLCVCKQAHTIGTASTTTICDHMLFIPPSNDSIGNSSNHFSLQKWPDDKLHKLVYFKPMEPLPQWGPWPRVSNQVTNLIIINESCSRLWFLTLS